MKTSQIPFRTLREAPAEAIISSHQLMMRADLIRKLGNGLYTYMPLGLRAYRKLENIIRQELDASGAMEFKPTVVVPGDIWKESGRWDTMGAQMLKAQNRQQQRDFMLWVSADKPQDVAQITFVHANQMIIPCIIQPGHLPGGLAVAVDAMFCQLLPCRRIDRISDFPCTGGG